MENVEVNFGSAGSQILTHAQKVKKRVISVILNIENCAF